MRGGYAAKKKNMYASWFEAMFLGEVDTSSEINFISFVSLRLIVAYLKPKDS